LGATGLFAGLYLVLSIWWPLSTSGICWIVTFLATATAIAISLPARTYSLKTLKSLAQLPLGFWLTLKALFKLKGANKKFIHTEHGIDEHS
jgi:predicted anti-sigma-YlaC factor YlaD